MRVLVTGCSGQVGVAVTAHLCDQGMEVVGLDLAESPDSRVDFRCADLMSYDTLLPHLQGVAAVLHLAAWPNPRVARSQDVFALNDAGSFNVFQACAEQGVRRVVAASSINAIGFLFGTEGFELSYLPVDEDHPCFTTDPYSFSKQILEEIGRYFWRREGITSTCLRFGAGLRPVAEIVAQQGDGYRMARDFIEELLALPDDAQRSEVDRMQKAYDTARRRRPFEEGAPWEGLSEAELRVMNLAHNYVTFVDLDDAAIGMRLALTTEYEGSHPLFILDRFNALGLDAADLARLFYPGVPARAACDGPQSLVDWRRAQTLIGYEAGITISDHYDALYGKPEDT